MASYIKTFEVRWSDLDTKEHLVNVSYGNYVAHARRSFSADLGFDQVTFYQMRWGPNY